MNTTEQLLAMLPKDEGEVLLDMTTITKATPLLVVRRALALYQVKVLIEWMPDEEADQKRVDRIDLWNNQGMKERLAAELRAKLLRMK